jgi:hypothetical protein
VARVRAETQRTLETGDSYLDDCFFFAMKLATNVTKPPLKVEENLRPADLLIKKWSG